jgi:formylglycine-generating enzyme required for sulfatase activity
LITWGGIEGYGTLRASALVESLQKVGTSDVPTIVKQLSGYRRWADPQLMRAVQSSDDREHLHASLALLPVDSSQVDYLLSRLVKAAPSELPVLRDALKPHSSTLIPKLWTKLESAKPGDAGLLPSASALAIYDLDDGKWESVGGKVAQSLVSVNSLLLRPWIEALRPVRGKLTVPLAALFRDKERPELEHALATDILTDYASDDADLIANLQMDADPKAYAVFFPIAERQEGKTLPLFQAEIDKKATIPDSDKDSEMVKDRLAERQARAAIALLRMGKADDVFRLLRHSPDPRLRSFIVNWLSPLGADPKILAAELDRIDPNAKPTPAQGQQKMHALLFHSETSQRRALILSLGTYGMEGLSPGERETLIGKLFDLYRNDPDSGIHGAAEWTLRKWGQQTKLKELNAELMKVKDWGNRRWYVNGQGQTFAVIEGPVEFRMGSPPTEPERIAGNENPRRMLIPRRFAVAAREVTVEQFQRFLRLGGITIERYQLFSSRLSRYSPDPEDPWTGPDWYTAAHYCNWLSEQEGLPRDQWCYLPNEAGAYAEGMSIPANVLERTGYRLPTQAEWEYACRAGAITSRYYGHSHDLLDAYAWYQANSKAHAWRCGRLFPNDLGLYDMLGNVHEWCQDSTNASKPVKKEIYNDKINIHESIVEKTPRILRGGAFIYPPANVRSALRDWGAPANRISSYGFRPSRTYD